MMLAHPVAAAELAARWRKDRRTLRRIEAALAAFVRAGEASTADGGRTFRARRAA